MRLAKEVVAAGAHDKGHATGVQTTVSTNVGPGGAINAIGFNVLDNFIYGVVNNNGTNQIIRIANNGDFTLLPTVLETGFLNVGNVDTQGMFWISQNGRIWQQIDLDPASSTFGQVIASGDSTASLNAINSNGVSDWAYLSSSGDYFYSVINVDTQLVRWSRTTHLWQALNTYPGRQGDTIGALYAANGTTLYGSDNTSGDIIAFPIPSGSTRTISDGPPSGVNDGARCIYAADPQAAPAPTRSLTVTGPTAGTSTISASGTAPGTVIVTDGASTLSTTIIGSLPGTLTISQSGTVPGTVIITETPAGTIKQTTTGPVAGTTTILASGSVSGTVIVTNVPLPTYSCDASGYLIQEQTLFHLNLTTGFQATVNTNVGPGPVNAIGYNVLDNYIYGITDNNGVNQVIRIASNGDPTLLPTTLVAGV